MKAIVVTKCATVVALVCALSGAVAQTVDGHSGSQGQRGRCSVEKFECLSGQCIANELLCDGRPDCTDLSDETQVECTKPELICPDYAFTCNYGACVDGDATCNGVKDCVDNSDELLPRCPGVSSDPTSADCSFNQFTCTNGQCIDTTSVCDGAVDCRDSSDETITVCGSINCPQIVFRCSYGACVDFEKRCNGVSDCADGSDELPALCGGSEPSVTTSRPSTTQPPLPSSSEPTPPRPGLRQCLVPPQPENGRWKQDRLECPSGRDCDVPQGVSLEPGSHLVYSCDQGYKPRGPVDVYCGQQGKWSAIPVCIKIICKDLNSASTQAACENNEGLWINCGEPLLPGTWATVSCRQSYREDKTFATTRREHVRCNARGVWDPEPIRCVPECGRQPGSNTILAVGATPANISEFPWHATLYKDVNGRKEFICGATVIQVNLLVTAAHCVFNDNRRRVEPANLFHVITGNIFQDYDSPLHQPSIVRKASVKNIYIKCKYLGNLGSFALDIAILELERPFELSDILMPICLDQGNDQRFLDGQYGKVAGFGRTGTASDSQQSSFVLLYVTLPYVPFNECKISNNATENEKYITDDKFCAGYTNGTAVCNGDSGGGLAFKKGDGLWYLRGIVSVSLESSNKAGTSTCNEYSYSLYTRVYHHLDWIYNVMFQLETRKSYPTCF